jgi:hypothetical protein
MFILIWLVFCLAAASLILLPLALWQREIYKRHSGGRLLACPENQQAAVVNIDARHAALTGVDGLPRLRLSDCTRWPEHADCNRACLSEAARARPYTPPELKLGKKQIYHLPILLAAFAAWYLGLIWHAQYMFRPRWMDALGLAHPQADPVVIAWWNSLHLLTAAACLLFAYGVAWLLVALHRKGVLHGVLMAVLLCGAVMAASWTGIAKLPHDLLMIEAGYTALATLIVGVIVGGLYDKLVLPSQ